MKKYIREFKHQRVRKKITGTSDRPRLAVFRSHQHIYSQIIDDSKGQTLAAASDLKLENGTKKEKAQIVGETLAKVALKKNIKEVVFDRGGFIFHGRVAAVAEGARKGGLKF